MDYIGYSRDQIFKLGMDEVYKGFFNVFIDWFYDSGDPLIPEIPELKPAMPTLGG